MGNTAQSLASRRIAALLDENSFVEIGGRVSARSTDFNMQQAETPTDGVITGYGVIDGNLVYVYSQDASVLGGTIGEMHAKKITAIYDMAMKMGAPVIGLVDCAGLRLQEATDALNGFGEIYMKQTLASGVVPQITAVLGTCGGGLAVSGALTDFVFMENKKAKLFVNSPNALDGNEVSRCDTASAKFQSEEAGAVDFTGTEDEVLAGIRQLVCMLPANNEDDASYEECTDDLNRVCKDLANAAGDTSILLSNIADDSVFVETQADFAKEMVTGFVRMNGMTVGVVANRTEVYGEDGGKTAEFDAVLTTKGARKAAKLVRFCDAFEIPVVSFTNVKGFKADKHSERGIAKAAAELTYAFANATVPKVNVVIGAAYGSAYVTMNSKAIGADMTFAWPTAEIGMMDARSAAKIMYPDADAAVLNEKAAEYAGLQSNVTSAAKHGYVDTIIEAEDTRKYVIGALEMLFTKREDRPAKKHGTV
ncbi:MAG: carboxyl transferase [Lachnospiraceae bacterium]|jgi:acetyl-CoA carboxylase carboxyltransferase component|uniref:acyl-CoA carboxylase subunit beta n=1 Tax=Hominisplanchenecus murintestinalis TaxID=2941517 RepID=UPI00203E42FB|nr:carboxyl transferase domain-containing protein [Hominisplanchenecus murintestinalis]MCI9516397.1 carboxyl transferase [Lachnospiraceae bacterium]MCI9660876.1 carboxyl transferase [Lachnospiraceae bacterium]